MWEKSKWTTECDKRTVTYDVRTAQCEDKIVKYEKSKGTTKGNPHTKHVQFDEKN